MNPSQIEEILPLSPLQEGLLFHALYDGAGSAGELDPYIQQVPLEFRGRLDAALLRRAFDALLERHASLRSGFLVRKAGNPVQVVGRGVRVPWQEADLSGLDGETQTVRLRELLTADRAARFDPARPPLLRVLVARLAENRHMVLVTSHHMLWDGWSMSRVMADLGALYAQDADPAGLDPVVPFRDYLAWLAVQDQGRAEAAWSRALSGTEGPCLVAPGAGSALAGSPARIGRSLSGAVTGRLAAVAREHGLTLNTVVQGAWALLVASLTGQDDVVFGATVSGRPPQIPGVEDIVGLLINTVPVRVRLDPAKTLAQLLRTLQDDQAELSPYHHLSLTTIQRLAGTTGNLFDTSITFQNLRGNDELLRLPGLEVRQMDEVLQGEGFTHFPLRLEAVPDEDEFFFELSYRPDVFDSEAAQGLADRLGRLLEVFAAQPGLPVGRVEVMDPAERTRILHTWSGSAAPVPDRTLIELFEDQAAATPDRTALITDAATVTYAELNSRANQLARWLRAHGAEPERPVAVLTERSAESVEWLLAVLKAGAAYLPLDPEAPENRTAQILDDAKPTHVLTGRALGHPAARVDPGRLGPALAGLSPANLNLPVPPDQLAYITYTSGSTGTPKGVLATHRGAANYLHHATGALARITPRDTLISLTAFTFDASLREIFGALTTGAPLVILTDDQRRDPASIISAVTRHHVTVILASVPSLLAQLTASHTPLPPGQVRLTLSSGESIKRLPAPGRETLGTLINTYGPTETTMTTTFAPPPHPGPGPDHIGRPLPNARVYLLDHRLQPVPPHTPGDLYIAGPGLARGYLGQPAETAARFTADPYGPPGTRIYRTGDTARWNTRGHLEYLGRTDDQIKIRGNRVEPAEIETALRTCPHVTDAYVQAREDHHGTRHLTAYLTPATAPDPATIRAHLTTRLPDYMIPAAYVTLDHLPRTTTGKINRHALPEPQHTPAAASRQPRNPREQLLCTLITDILGTTRTGIDDDFFTLGGDSISSIQLVAAARKAGLMLTPKDVFTGKTVAKLAEIAQETEPPAAAQLPPPSRRRPLIAVAADRRAAVEASFDGLELAEILPLSPLQPTYLHALLAPDAALDPYLIQLPLELGGATLDASRLRAAFDALLARHPSLRAAFPADGGPPFQAIARGVRVPWREVDLSGLDEETRAVRVRELLDADRAARFDPARPPLLRVTVARLCEDRHLLVITSHHIVWDGWSIRRALRDLFALYEARGDGGALPPAVSVREHLAWIAEQPRDAADAAWAAELSGLSGPTLVAPGLDAALGEAPARVEASLPAALTERLTHAARVRGLTLNTVVQGAWALLLAGLTERDDVVFGTTVSGRPPHLPGVEDIVGLLINTVPVRVRVDPEATMASVLADLQRRQSELADFHHLGLAALEARAGVGPALFDTTVAFQSHGRATGLPDRADREGELRITPAGEEFQGGYRGGGAYHYALRLVVFPETSLGLELCFRPEAFDAEACTLMLARLGDILAGLAGGFDAAAGQLAAGAVPGTPVLTPAY